MYLHVFSGLPTAGKYFPKLVVLGVPISTGEIMAWWAVRYIGAHHCHTHRSLLYDLCSPASTKALRSWLGLVLGSHTTQFCAACQPKWSTGMGKKYRTHPLGWLLLNLGCIQLHVGQQPVSACMHVCVTGSIWMSGLQYSRSAMPTGLEECTDKW